MGLVVPRRKIPEAYRFKMREIKAGGTPQLIRRVHCFKCNTVLAEEAGKRGETAVEWRAIGNEGHWTTGKWWGNPFTCPTCGTTGKLPMDKPLMEGS